MAYASLKHIVDQQLADIRTKGLYKSERQLLSPQGSEIRVAQGHVLNLCANNYLGLANHSQSHIGGHGRIEGPWLRNGIRAIHLRNTRPSQTTRTGDQHIYGYR